MELVCHYCSIPAFFEMINHIDKKGNEYFIKFWASSIYAMNDPYEFVYGYELLMKSILPDIEKEIGITDSKLKLSQILNQLPRTTTISEWNKKILNAIYESDNCPFIVSFSKRIDYLPMWNTYSDRGKGVCLCFKDHEWKWNETIVDIKNHLNASEVTYGEFNHNIKRVIRDRYKELYSQYKNVPEGEQRLKDMIMCLATLAIIASPYHKHKAYEYEEEVRLIENIGKNYSVKYRLNNNNRIIPYIEVPVKLEYLNKIIVGPCADSESVIRELKNMLSKYNITNILASSIPYREY